MLSPELWDASSAEESPIFGPEKMKSESRSPGTRWNDRNQPYARAVRLGATLDGTCIFEFRIHSLCCSFRLGCFLARSGRPASPGLAAWIRQLAPPLLADWTPFLRSNPVRSSGILPQVSPSPLALPARLVSLSPCPASPLTASGKSISPPRNTLRLLPQNHPLRHRAPRAGPRPSTPTQSRLSPASFRAGIARIDPLFCSTSARPPSPRCRSWRIPGDPSIRSTASPTVAPRTTSQQQQPHRIIPSGLVHTSRTTPDETKRGVTVMPTARHRPEPILPDSDSHHNLISPFLAMVRPLEPVHRPHSVRLTRQSHRR